MRSRIDLLMVGVAAVVFRPAVAFAGMPSITLTDLARMRLDAISFFAVIFLLSAKAIQFLWNMLQKDWHTLPRLGYGRALAIVALWGCLFLLVLTMISGARELMTPGAWEKTGLTYRLAQQPSSESVREAVDIARHKKLEALRRALWTYADAHGGKLPPDTSATGIAHDLWQMPDASGMKYLYIPGQTAGRGAVPLAFEPELFGAKRLVLLTNADIKEMDPETLTSALTTWRGP